MIQYNTIDNKSDFEIICLGIISFRDRTKRKSLNHRFRERVAQDMGSYLNPGSERFRTSLRSQIYVDKSMLIAEINKLVRTEQKYVCVSRPRRFGKSMAADMLLAYYSAGEDTATLFNNLKISKAKSYREHLNQYDVLKINIQEFLSSTHDVDSLLTVLQKTYFIRAEISLSRDCRRK